MLSISRIINRIINKFKKKKYIFLAIFFISAIVVLKTDLSPDLYFIHRKPLENISCYYFEEGNVLQSAESEDFSPPESSIFFHETSCRGTLNSRQACAVESAAKIHPDWQINLLFLAPVNKSSLKSGSLAVLNGIHNIRISRLHLSEYAKGTPLESMIADGALNRTRWRISHTSDVVRYLTLYKWGGVYLDLDVIVAKHLGSLARNWAAREDKNTVAAGALSFSRDALGRYIAEASIRDMRDNFRGDSWGHNGPGTITRVLRRICQRSKVTSMSAAVCSGFEVYSPEYFYPVSWRYGRYYFKDGDLKLPHNNAHAYHMWNKLTMNYQVSKSSPYAKLAKEFCPNIYSLYGDRFGS